MKIPIAPKIPPRRISPESYDIALIMTKPAEAIQNWQQLNALSELTLGSGVRHGKSCYTAYGQVIKITDKYAILAFLEDGACSQNIMVLCVVTDAYRCEEAMFSLSRWAGDESFSLHKALSGLYSQDALDAMINKETKFLELRCKSDETPAPVATLMHRGYYTV